MFCSWLSPAGEGQQANRYLITFCARETILPPRGVCCTGQSLGPASFSFPAPAHYTARRPHCHDICAHRQRDLSVLGSTEVRRCFPTPRFSSHESPEIGHCAAGRRTSRVYRIGRACTTQPTMRVQHRGGTLDAREVGWSDARVTYCSLRRITWVDGWMGPPSGAVVSCNTPERKRFPGRRGEVVQCGSPNECSEV